MKIINFVVIIATRFLMKKISQRDIATALGVNVSAVSRALRGLDGVSPELRHKIKKYAEDNGYSLNQYAISYRYTTIHTIGIIVPDISFNHYAHIVKHIESEAKKSGYLCIITDSGDKYENEVECLEHLVNIHVEGIIICLSQETSDYSHLQKVNLRCRDFR